jgi:putative DNA primase/helicase
MTRGASPQDWMHFDLVLGLGADLLPVVADPDAPRSAGSKIIKFGKTPSAYDREGNAHGFKAWTKRDITPDDIRRWSSDDRLSLCVRASACRAIDVDITKPELAQRIADALGHQLTRAIRTRANSSKFLVPLHVPGALPKRIIYCGAAGRIEFLGNGQQWLAAGPHQSGTPYEWTGGLPESIPELTLDEFEALWSTLQQFAVSEARVANDKPEVASGENTLLTEATPQQLEDLKSALAYPPLVSTAADNTGWTEIGYALLSLGDVGRALWQDFSASAPGYEPAADDDWWDAHSGQTPRSDFRHIFTLARRLGWRTLADVAAFPVVDLVPDLNPAAKPVLRLTAGQLDRYAVAAESILSPEVFTQSGGLVRIGAGTEVIDETLNRSAEQRAIIRVTAEYLRRKLNELADIQKYSKTEEEWRPIDCPKDLAVNILDQRDWPKLRALEAISRAPFLRNDKTVCETPGYDASSGVMYIPNSVFPALPAAPTRDDALTALDALAAPFTEFPYATAGARSAFIAHILTEVARVALDAAPMFWYSAPSAGTGKTLLSKMAAIITHGSEVSLRPWVDDNEEIRKVIFASLLAGDRSIGFDNVPNGAKIRSSMLCALLTSGNTYQDRRLGASEVVTVKNKATCFASGNNITPVSDMARRSLIIRLDADVTSKELRKRSFSIMNLESYVKLHRPQLLVHALTVIRAYFAADSRVGVTPLPSFERWSEFVREPLLWLGLADPIDTQEEETDDELDSTAAAFSTLATMTSIGAGREFYAKQVVDAICSMFDTDGAALNALISAGCGDPTNPNKVGYWLRDKRDVIAGGYKLERGRRTTVGGQTWVFRAQHTGPNEDLL